MKIGDNTHPADELGKSLSQARGLISSMINCFDKSANGFVTGQIFVAEAMVAVEDILSKASGSLAALYENYDLTATAGSSEDAELELADEEIEPVVVQEEEYRPSSFGLFGRHNTVSSLANKLGTIAESLPQQTASEPMRPEEMIEQPAQNYEELLEKLSAMADSAAYHTSAGREQDGSLLPVLESLRADVLRMRSVA